ncbi:peptide/nickel transport system substrate-binding protein [Blastococcus sp. DSM 46786]|uniref:ABC transporter substrate-binding protein n=1 Tax=Blastococcus sp. DSM 46786 TaxID=1798227 RepID=UPI0008B90CBC|nr:ABC transporter substrate-binding protein [Blastococcus sp. DSM 46786]SEK73167.1 peptide/nickel transport system substrate-binding protein [Blastococcus sp. DSM 46786]
MKRGRTHALRSTTALVIAAGLLAGCGSADDPVPGESQDQAAIDYAEGMVGEDSGGEPVSGGSLDYAAYAEPRSLDPAVTIAAGTTGGIEMINIYDSLTRYDAEGREFVPQLAESLAGNADSTEFTLTLREGVTFSDGTPLDSAAVKWSQERYAAENGPESALWVENVRTIETPDPTTVVYRLSKPWALFPSILSTGPGMIVAESSTAGDAFTPIGAGPFVLESWAPEEDLVLAANEDYWDGRPHLDQVRSVFLSDQQTGLDSLANGAVDAVLVRDPEKVDPWLEGGGAGYLSMVAAANVALINATEGRPGADPRVRRAMAMAIDPQLIKERAFEGHGLAGSTLFPEYSRWHTDTEALPYDPEEARRLLEEAKADGYDGVVEYIDASDPVSRATSLAVQANLEAVGFTVETELLQSIADQISRIAVNRDYDVAAWGNAYREGDPLAKMYPTLHSSGTQTYGMATSPEMDALLEDFQAAATTEEQLDVMDAIQQQVNETVPFLDWGPLAELIVWSDDVHGVQGAMASMVLFDEAWIG